MADISPTARPVYMGAHVKVVPTVRLKDKKMGRLHVVDGSVRIVPPAQGELVTDPVPLPQAPLSPSPETEEPSKSKSQSQKEEEDTELNPDTPGPPEG